MLEIDKPITDDCRAWLEAEYNAEITNGLRYKIFDIGRLLLRNDLKSHRNDAWRETVSMFFEDAKAFGSLSTRLDYIDCLLRGMKAALDMDQHEHFEFVLHRRIHDACSTLTARLILNGRKCALPEFSWSAACGKDEPYNFAVDYRDRVYYKDGTIMWERAELLATA